MDIKSLTDEQLMSVVARGGMAEFGELVTRHQDKAFALALRTLGHWDLAEDISQKAFLRVYHSAKRYHPKAKFPTWLYRIVVNLCLDEKRKAKRTSMGISGHSEYFESKSEGNPVATLETEERKNAVWRALEKLNNRERVAVVLHRFHGLSHAEVASTMGGSQSAVESLLVRSYQKLRKELEKYKNSGK
jgi:RNA polymerase sigma-70 factor (ECF subfamily)